MPLRFGLHEVVEVLEQFLRLPGPFGDMLAHRLGEGFGTRRVQHGEPSRGQGAEKGERDHALPAAGPAGDHHDGLQVLLARLVDRVQDDLVRQPLFVQQHELVAIADLLRGVLEKLLGGTHLAAQEAVGCGAPRCGGEPVPQIVNERPASRLGEQARPVVLDGVVEIGDVSPGGVVQVRDGVQGVGLLGQFHKEPIDVVGVALGLQGRVQLGFPRHVVDQHAARILVPHLGVAPLLQFDHHVRVAAGAPIDPREHHVRALTGQRQLVLDEHLDLAQPRLGEVLGEDREAAFPGPHLGRGDRDPVPHLQLLGEDLREPLLGG